MRSISLTLLVEMDCDHCGSVTKAKMTKDWPWARCGHCGQSMSEKEYDGINKLLKEIEVNKPKCPDPIGALEEACLFF